MMNRRILTFLILSAAVSLGYVNCSGPGFQTVEMTALSSLGSSSTDPGNEDAVPDASGKMTALQDRQFRFRIPAASVTGATNLPSWASLNTLTREVTGAPTVMQTHSGITISTPTGVLGPYSIEVTGDPLKAHQWHLSNTGQSTFSANAGISGEDIHLSQTIRDGILGTGIRIAISDTGIVETHRGLSPNMIAGGSRNYFNDFASMRTWSGSSTPDVTDADNAHGTAVAGLAAERGWKGFGARGVAPFARLAGFLFIPAQETLSTRGYYSQGLYDQYAGDFDVFNYSWGDSQCAMYEYSNTYKEKMKAGTALRGGKGAVFVKAAGNDYSGYSSDCHDDAGDDAWYLGNAGFSEEATTPYTIMVGALNARGKTSSYSSPGANVWISAPGGEYGHSKPSPSTDVEFQPALLTTDFPGCSKGLKSGASGQNDFEAGQAPNTNCEYTSTMNGTSGASPIVAGAAALMLAANPNLTWRDVKHILAKTADKIDPTRAATAHPTTNLSGHTYELGWTTNAAGYNFHNWYGFGRVNVDAAVNMAKTYVSVLGNFKETNSGTSWKYDSGTLNVSIPAGSATGAARSLAVSENMLVEAVQVRLSATGCIGNLGVELTSPSGTKSIIMNINSYLLDTAIESHVFLSNSFYGENAAGNWSLKLIGAKSGCTTTWQSWQLNVMGH